MSEQMSLATFIQTHGIRFNCKPVDHNPYMEDKSWQANHWRITIVCEGRRLTTYFSQGQGITHEPTLEDVLDCLASEAQSYDNARSFEEWASELGYDTDSIKAQRTYNAIGKSVARLKKLLGEHYHTLLYDVERM